MIKKNFILLFAWSFLHFGTKGYSATATKINVEKKQVVIDEGKERGVNKKEKVCFFNQEKKKVACGKVSKVKKDSSIVTVKKHIDKIEEGFTAKIEGHEDQGESEKKTSNSHAAKEPYSFALRFFYPLSLLSNTSHKDVFYDPPSNQLSVPQSVDTLWSPDPNPTTPLFTLAFGAEAEYAPLKLHLGVRYKQLSPLLLEGNYGPASPSAPSSISALTTITGSALGGYLDFFFLKLSFIKIGVGLDANLSSISLSVMKTDEAGTETPLVIGTSKTTVFSLRIPVQANIPLFSKLGLTVGLIPSIPLMATAPAFAFESELDDAANTAKLSQDPATDLGASLKHTKGSFGLEILTGLYFGF